MSNVSTLQLLWLTSWLLVLVTCGLAFWRGRQPERLSAGVILLGGLLAQLVAVAPPEVRSSVALCVDGLAAVAFLLLTVRYASLWLGGIMVLQAAQFSLHSVYVLSQRPLDATFSMINNALLLGQLACLAIGVVLAERSTRRTFSAPAGSPPRP